MTNDFFLIIDGSSLLSTQYYGNLPKEILYAKTEEERSKSYYKLMQTSKGVYTNGVFGFCKTLFSIIRYQKPKYLAVCWDMTRDTFRREIYKEYKGTRKETPEPLKEQFQLCQNVLKQIGVAQFFSETYEADDYAGSLAERFKSEIPISIMTKDRDYLQLVDDRVSLWMVTASAAKADEMYARNGVKKADFIVPDSMFYLTPELVKKEYGFLPEKTVMVKQLAGDTADNIPGVKGIGEKTAIALANAYPSIEAMYDEIRDLDDKGLDAVKKRWKEELGIKRSPFKYLLAKSEGGELLGEDASVLSKKLAQIKKDIDLSGYQLEDLSLKLKEDAVTKMFHELEFHSLSLDGVELDFLDGEQNVEPALDMTVITSKKEAEQCILSMINEEKAGISLLISPKKEKKPVAKQMELFDLMQDVSKQNEEDATSESQVFEHKNSYFNRKDVLGIALSKEKGKSVLIFKNEEITMGDLVSYVDRLYTGDVTVAAFDVKEQLCFVDPKTASRFVLCSEEKMPAFDVSIAAYLLNPLKNNYTPYEVCMDYYHTIRNREALIGKRETIEVVQDSFQEICETLCEEAQAAYVLEDRLKTRLKEVDMWKLFYTIEMPAMYTLYEMEKNGVIVKREALKQYENRLTGSINELEQTIYEKAGHTFNINSPKQLGVVLFEEMHLPGSKKTKTGYSTSADVLERLRSEHDIVDDILEYRQLTKLRSTYAEGLANYICKDGRIHGHFNQMVTATGRISSTEPNLQNIPMRTPLGREIRKVFLPQEGDCFVDADYSQIELRILAHMSKDPTLISAFREEKDIHAITASQVFHVPFEEVTNLQRRNAKAVNFGIVYGISAHGLSVDLGISRKEASDYMNQYFATYPCIKGFLESLVEEGKKEGQVKTLFSRIRPIPELHSTNFNQRNFGERVAMNSPIQGTAADIMKLAMIRTYRGLIKENCESRLVLQIHDELVVETKKEELEKVKEIVTDAMKNACELAVELAVDLNVGENWYDAK